MKFILSFFVIWISLTLPSFSQSGNHEEQKVSILLGHRYSGGFYPFGYEQFEYMGLFKEKDKYYLKPTYVKISAKLDDCSGDSIFSIRATTKGDCLFFLWGLKQYTKDAIASHHISPDKRYALPKKNYVFTFNKTPYSFITQGKIEGNTTQNYRLILLNENTKQEQTLFFEELLDNSKVELMFIGDLDGDGQPDLIINAPPNNETRNILLFLSSFAEEGELVHCVSEQFDWFDC